MDNKTSLKPKYSAPGKSSVRKKKKNFPGYQHLGTQKEIGGELPGGPAIKTSPSNAGGAASIHRVLRSHVSQDQSVKQE